MIAGSAEEGSPSSKPSWNPKAVSSFIFLNAGNAATVFGVNRRPDARHLAPNDLFTVGTSHNVMQPLKLSFERTGPASRKSPLDAD